MNNNKSKIRMEYLSAKSFTNYGESYENAVKVSERMLSLVKFLKSYEKIEMQIIMSKESTPLNYIFASPNSNVSIEDFNWIFTDYAKVIPERYLIADTDKESGQKEYELIYSPYKKENEEYGDEDFYEKRDVSAAEEYMENRMAGQYFFEMCREMEKIGASIKIVVWGAAGHEGSSLGKIVFSFPKEIPMRIRTLAAIVFPNTILCEADNALEKVKLPSNLLKAYIVKLLKVLELEQRRPSDDIDKDSIEYLELSPRSYHSLKRAGITTIKQLCKMKDEDLRRVRNLGIKCVHEIKIRLEELRKESPEYFLLPKEVNYMERLESLVGIKAVKNQVKQITAFAKMQKDMYQRGKKRLPITLNMEFVGNPGTAKTTVARITAGLFSEIGLTETDGLVEVGRADLIADYAGQTAGKVKSVFEKAKGKVLFIDEAYSLVEKWEGSYGDEAVNAIVQEMENNREDTIVIFAGYPDKMKEFFSRNPGLRSRVPFTIKFDDYSVDELTDICELEAKKMGFKIESSAVGRIKAMCEKIAGNADMGNGRFCRNLIEKAILAFAERMYGGENVNEIVDYALAADDFTTSNVVFEEEKASIGFKM